MVEVHMSTSATAVCLSTGMCFLGSYITISLCEQLRFCSLETKKSKIFNRRNLLLMMACSLGGICCWSMHFIHMSEIVLKTSTGIRIPIAMHIFPTVLSILPALLLAWVGLYISSRDVLFTKDKKEIVEMFVQKSAKLSIKQVRNIGVQQIIYLIGTNSLQNLILGGFVYGSGMVAMHYLGLWSIDFHGRVNYDIGIVAASIIIAMITSIVAFWILFRLLSIYPHLEILRLASATIMTAGVAAVHYIAFQSASFRYYGYDNESKTTRFVQHVFGVADSLIACEGALVAAIALLMLLVILTLADLRAWVYETKRHLAKADKLLATVQQNNHSIDAINRYMEERENSIIQESNVTDNRAKPTPNPSLNNVPISVYSSRPRIHSSTIIAGGADEHLGVTPNKNDNSVESLSFIKVTTCATTTAVVDSNAKKENLLKSSFQKPNQRTNIDSNNSENVVINSNNSNVRSKNTHFDRLMSYVSTSRVNTEEETPYMSPYMSDRYVAVEGTANSGIEIDSENNINSINENNDSNADIEDEKSEQSEGVNQIAIVPHDMDEIV